MERIHCINCNTDIRTISKETSKNTSVIRQACQCNDASHDAHPYEVEGWEWVEDMDDDTWRELQEQISGDVNESLGGPRDGGRIT